MLGEPISTCLDGVDGVDGELGLVGWLLEDKNTYDCMKVSKDMRFFSSWCKQ